MELSVPIITKLNAQTKEFLQLKSCQRLDFVLDSRWDIRPSLCLTVPAKQYQQYLVWAAFQMIIQSLLLMVQTIELRLSSIKLTWDWKGSGTGVCVFTYSISCTQGQVGKNFQKWPIAFALCITPSVQLHKLDADWDWASLTVNVTYSLSQHSGSFIREQGLMTCNTAHHQRVIEMLWLYVWGALM